MTNDAEGTSLNTQTRPTSCVIQKPMHLALFHAPLEIQLQGATSLILRGPATKSCVIWATRYNKPEG